MNDLVIKDSKINGKGIFANRDFKKGEVVIKWDVSHKLDKKDIEKISENEKKYVVFNGGDYILMQSPARYVNHSCNANTMPKNQTDIAIRDIRKGEEITSDYSKDLVPGFEMKCECGYNNCRKIIKFSG